MTRRGLPLADLKRLLMASGGICAYPGCGRTLIPVDPASKSLVITGEMAHILPFGAAGPRAQARNNEASEVAENYLVLCPEHHQFVDKRAKFYSVAALREMKANHEFQIRSKLTDSNGCPEVEIVSEELVSSIISIQQMPKRVHSAGLHNPRITPLELLHSLPQNSDVVVFILREGRVYTFTSLRGPSSVFRGLVDSGTSESYDAAQMCESVQGRQYYVALLNQLLAQYLKNHNVRFDRDHKRYYFRSREKEARDYRYRTSSGVHSTRSVVWNPVTKATGLGKKFWWHLAARIQFHLVGNSTWVMSIRPERYLTEDGVTPLPPLTIGKKVTKLKARMYNDKYLDELVFWKDVLSNGTPRILLQAGQQSLIASAQLCSVQVEWPGIPDDNKAYISQPYEDNLFSLADLEEALGSDDEEDDF